MEAAAGLFQRAATDAGSRTGTVRITASEIVGAELLSPILSDLRAAFPALMFEVVVTNTTLDLLRYEADLAVRMVRPAQGDLIASKAATLRVGFFAHERFFARHPAPESLPRWSPAAT